MDEGKHYSFLPASMISTFRDHVAPPDLPKMPIWPKILIIQTGLFFGGFFLCGKKQSYRRINTVTAMDRTRLIPEEKKNKLEIAGKKNESQRFLRVGQSTANLQKFKDGLNSSFTPKKPNSF